LTAKSSHDAILSRCPVFALQQLGEFFDFWCHFSFLSQLLHFGSVLPSAVFVYWHSLVMVNGISTILSSLDVAVGLLWL
jgi:hypothetical protein